MEGKKKKLKLEHFNRFGEGLGLTGKQMDGVFNRLSDNKLIALKLINNSFLSHEMNEAYKEVLEERYARFSLNIARI